jgi:predicted Zn-dependent peptidase
MSTVKEIESAIVGLSPKEIAELRSWCQEFAAQFSFPDSLLSPDHKAMWRAKQAFTGFDHSDKDDAKYEAVTLEDASRVAAKILVEDKLAISVAKPFELL